MFSKSIKILPDTFQKILFTFCSKPNETCKGHVTKFFVTFQTFAGVKFDSKDKNF